MIGTELAHYRILDRIGSGGMGDVYLAEDKKLGRRVAIKTLPSDVAKDEERLARFTREARTLAALNHANIATLHGLEEANGEPFLVMECVQGDTLEERLQRGAIPLDEALPLLLQTAESLEAAHRAGIIHRDLKPANIKITPDGQVKVLDFGLAKALERPGVEEKESEVLTRARGETQAGVILGTAPYMSPEQARGQTVDGRTDVWAFGCLCYEVLAGQRAFDGATVTDALASVIHKEPDWGQLPKITPRTLRRGIQRCLRKDARRRLHDIADARTEIEDLLSEPSEDGEEEPSTRRRPSWALVGVALTAALVAYVFGRELGIDTGIARTAPRPIRVGLPIDREIRIGGLTNSVYQSPLAISSDGQTLAFVAESDEQLLYVRRLDEFEARPLEGTQGAMEPFFSPDGEWLGFLTDKEMRKIALSGGAPQRVCEVPFHPFRNAVWGPDDSIVFFHGNSGLMQVSANGGEAERLTTPDASAGHALHAPVQFLNERRELLFQLGR